MRNLIFIIIAAFNISYVVPQENKVDKIRINEDLNEILNDISQNYVYLKEKNIDLKCIKNYYENQITDLQTEEDTVLFFEYLLDEFYDSHLILNTNRTSSFRLYSSIYATVKNGTAKVSNVWQTQIEHIDYNIIGAEILKINHMPLLQAIEQFPTHCNDKNSQHVREWIVNKILAGRYNEPRLLTLKLESNQIVEFDLNKFKILKTSNLLTSKIENEIGIIRINNALGNHNLISEFDQALKNLMNTKGLIIDLRNTVDGGNSYVARGIMSRFITETKPYQKHWTTEQFDGSTRIERSWVEYVGPREKPYLKPIVILVGRWTGSMGEGLAIGFEGMERAEIVGSEMERLAGEINSFTLKHQTFGYQLSTAKLYHLNGTPREKYVPKNYIIQTRTDVDETLAKGIELINNITE